MKKRGIGIVLSYANTALNMITGLVLSSFLLRVLGDTEYGLYQTVSSFSTYLVLLEFGTGTVMTRNISVCLNSAKSEKRQDAVNRNYSTIWFISLIISLVMIIVGLVFYSCMGIIYAKTMTVEQIGYGKTIFLILLAFIVSNYLTQNINGMLLAHEEYAFEKIVFLVKLILRTLLLIGVIYFFRYSILIAVIDLGLSVAALIVTFVYCRKKYHIKVSLRYFDKSVFIMSIPMCLALMLQAVTNQANSNVDKFVIGVMMSMESVALYSIVQYVFTMFSSVATIPVSMFLPEVSRNMSKKLSPEEFTDTLVYPCRLTTIICGTILFGFFAVGKQFIALFYGADKTDAWVYALIILVPMFVNMTDAVIINVLDVANKRLVRSLALLGTTIANIILTVLLIGQLGIIGAVLATAVSLVVGNIIVMNVYYYKTFKIRILYLYKEAYKGVLPIQIVSALIAYFSALWIDNTLLSFLTGGLVFVVLSFSMMALFGLKVNEKERLAGLIRKVIKRK